MDAILRTAFSAAVPAALIFARNDSGSLHPIWYGFLASVLTFLIFTHTWLPSWALRWFFSGDHLQRAVLVGDPSRAARLGDDLLARRDLGVVPVGWLGVLECEGGGDQRIPHLGSATELEEVIRRGGVEQVILAGVSSSQVSPSRLAAVCERHGLRLTLAHELGGAVPKPVEWETQGQWCMGAFHREPLQSPWGRCLKRLLDVCVALPATVLVLAPVSLLTWWAQRRQSPGPLFCRQWRHGRGNRPFKIWKFRTMHLGNAPIAKQATRGDARIYPFGGLLRRHSLDELPQFLNVLLGQMSVVGPRPHLVEHTEEFSTVERYSVRAFVKPGITGLAQVHGCRGEVRVEEDLRRRVGWDVRYVEEWSLWLDMKIIFQTIEHVLFPPDSAY